ncbi:uncharacterized protein LOC118414327 [Branchiostoma floridae]|uniref:Uncharacterized protein LOC118414327 n=1 Tax=Branchiostoma floridae TaxID=7739 RepID=A0A9J7L1L6_BRAFL|nr:uncharacterized protein LOC118414327 [Branchiostoma floridae]
MLRIMSMLRSSNRLLALFTLCLMLPLTLAEDADSSSTTCDGSPDPAAGAEGCSITGNFVFHSGNCVDKSELKELKTRLQELSEFRVPDVEGETCISEQAGALRYNRATTQLQVCDGQNWQNAAGEAVSRRGESEGNPAMSCREIFTFGSYRSGLYWIRLSAQDEGVAQVWCEMGFKDGGWLRVFNMMAKGATKDEAAAMYNIIKRNGPIQAILPNTTSGAIYTQGLDLGMYHEVVYGWAKSSDDVVSHYGYYRDDLGLKGHCYIDGFCGDNTVVATMTSSVTREKKEIKTGSDPSYPHVGLGWTGQQITWGYDLNTSPHGHWGNWYTSSCCLTGNTADIRDAGSNWRYSILIR